MKWANSKILWNKNVYSHPFFQHRALYPIFIYKSWVSIEKIWIELWLLGGWIK